MSFLKSKFPLIIPAIYMLAVVVSILLSFDYSGRVSDWIFLLMGLTLPWSIVTVFFMWSLFHGAGLEFFTVMFLLFGGINTFILYLLCSVIRRNLDRDVTSPQWSNEQ